MGAAIVLLLVGLAALAAGVLIGRYYVPDDRQLRRTARHGRAFMRALSHLIARDHDTVVRELRAVVEENIDDVEPYFALGAMFRSRGEHERAIRVHQALAMREREKKKLRTRAMYELGMDFRAAGMPRRATRAMEEVLIEEPSHEGALRSLAALYEEQARFAEAAELWERLGKRRGEDLTEREHHLYVAAAQAALGRGEPDAAKQLLKHAQSLAGGASGHFFAAAAELAAVRKNHRGARERIKQALVADPGIVVQLLPGLIAAEQGLAATAGGGGLTAELVAIGAEHDELAADAVPAADGAALAALADGAAPAALAAPAADAGSSPSPIQSLIQAASATTAIVAPPASASAIVAGTHPLVPEHTAPSSVTDRVLVTLSQVEQQTGPRLEIALIRAQLVAPELAAQMTRDLVSQFPSTLTTRVAVARLALAGREPAAVYAALDALAGEQGVVAWALRGRWQCGHCGHRPASFSWRCGPCRRWGTLVMETGIEAPPLPARDRRAAPRAARPEALLGTSPVEALPAATLDVAGDDDLGHIAGRRSLLGRVGGWMSGAWRRGA